MTVWALIDTDYIFVNHFTHRVTRNATCRCSDQATEDAAEQSSKPRADSCTNSRTGR